MSQDEVKHIVSNLKHQIDDLVNSALKSDIKRNSADIKELKDKYDTVQNETTKNTTKLDNVEKTVNNIERNQQQSNSKLTWLLVGFILQLVGGFILGAIK